MACLMILQTVTKRVSFTSGWGVSSGAFGDGSFILNPAASGPGGALYIPGV